MRMSVKTHRKSTAMPLQPGDKVASFMRPDITYTVVDRDRTMVKVRSDEDGNEGWVARSVLKKVEKEPVDGDHQS